MLADLLPALDQISDLIILLSDMPLADTEALIEKSSHVDVAIAADNTQHNIAPFFSTTTLKQNGKQRPISGCLVNELEGQTAGTQSKYRTYNKEEPF